MSPTSSPDSTRESFGRLSQEAFSHLHGDEVLLCNFAAEDSDFVRFNHSLIRQAGSVSQKSLDLDLIRGPRHAKASLQLSGDLGEDRPRIRHMIEDLQARLGFVPEDPYLLYETKNSSSETTMPSRLPESPEAIADIQKAGKGRDLVGIYAAGSIYAGFANSLGQNNWYSNFSYNMDWSFYHEKDKAVKTAYAGFAWDPKAFQQKVDWAQEQLQVLSKPARSLKPGQYRVYLAPSAMADLVSMLNRGGFSLKAHRTKQTPLLKLVLDEARFSPHVTLREDTVRGLAPNFQEQGFPRPDQVTLISAGSYKDCLVSPRTAKEYGVPTNGATAGEYPDSVDMAPGELDQDLILPELEQGLFINNLHYLNYSDRMGCRTTGLTRFATFWVEGGRIMEPLNVMRFDDTFYRMLGEKLVGLTQQRDMIVSSSSYGARSTNSARLPGALINDFTLTL